MGFARTPATARTTSSRRNSARTTSVDGSLSEGLPSLDTIPPSRQIGVTAPDRRRHVLCCEGPTDGPASGPGWRRLVAPRGRYRGAAAQCAAVAVARASAGAPARGGQGQRIRSRPRTGGAGVPGRRRRRARRARAGRSPAPAPGRHRGADPGARPSRRARGRGRRGRGLRGHGRFAGRRGRRGWPPRVAISRSASTSRWKPA